jgi:hypothetical protein
MQTSIRTTIHKNGPSDFRISYSKKKKNSETSGLVIIDTQRQRYLQDNNFNQNLIKSTN